jgi:hypothetical protein
MIYDFPEILIFLDVNFVTTAHASDFGVISELTFEDDKLYFQHKNLSKFEQQTRAGLLTSLPNFRRKSYRAHSAL